MLIDTQKRSCSNIHTALVLINDAATFEMTMSQKKDNLFPVRYEKVFQVITSLPAHCSTGSVHAYEIIQCQ